MNRIDRKHVDFLVCQPGSMQPTLGVELDDASHARADRQERDAFVDRVFAAAGLPLARFPAQAGYNTNEVRARLREAVTGGAGDATAGDGSIVEDRQSSEDEAEAQALGEAPAPPDAPPEASALSEEQQEPAPPACPRCGATMVLREVKREGPNQGERFWGCPNFPKCRGTRQLSRRL